MKLEFTKDEKQYISLILQDAYNAAKRGKDRETFREGKRLGNLFTPNSTTIDLKWKEFTVIMTMVEDSVPILEKVVEKNDKNVDIAKSNLEFAKNFIPRLKTLSEKWT